MEAEQRGEWPMTTIDAIFVGFIFVIAALIIWITGSIRKDQERQQIEGEEPKIYTLIVGKDEADAMRIAGNRGLGHQQWRRVIDPEIISTADSKTTRLIISKKADRLMRRTCVERAWANGIRPSIT